MRERLRQWWPALKVLFTIAIVAAVGWRFARDLADPQLWQRSFHWGWLFLSAVLYILGLGFSACYWYRLLRALGQEPRIWTAVRAYYVGQMGKYLPGKAWALFLRAALVHGRGVRLGVATMTSFYEVLTTMSTGALLAAVLFALLTPDASPTADGSFLHRLFTRAAADTAEPDRRSLVILSLVLLAGIGLPIVPRIFNLVVQRLSLPFKDRETEPLPPVNFRLLAEGVALTVADWLFFGVSLWAVLKAVVGSPEPWSLAVWGRCTAFMALAYVAGFVIFLVPSGIGVREFLLMVFLVPELLHLQGMTEGEARARAVLAVVLLRLVWTAAEVIVVAALYRWPGPKGSGPLLGGNS